MNQESDPLILAVETCTRAGSVSLARAKEILAAIVGGEMSSRSTDLIENIEQVLTKAEAHLFDVDLFAATIGPGSFTGLRIGLATVKALAVCTQRPCVAVSTLAAIALGAGDSARTVTILPAGRGEVYAQMFSVTGGTVRALDRESHIKPSRLLDKYGSNGRSIRFAGEGAHQYSKTLRQWAEEKGIAFYTNGADLAQEGWKLAAQSAPLSNSVAALALAAQGSGVLLNAAELHANYVRPSDAEINEAWQQRTQ